MGPTIDCPWGLVGTADLLYSRGVNQLDVRELNLASPAAVAFGEADRLLYGSIDDGGSAVPKRLSPAFERVTQIRNARGDRSFSATSQLQKHFAGGKELAISYTYTSARDLLSASEDALDANLDVVVLDGSLERRRLAPSIWSVPHRVTLLAIAALPLQFRLTLFYSGQSGSPFTYRVEGDANADGYVNDAVYVPRVAASGGDVQLVAENDQGQIIPAPDSEYVELDRFIEQQTCLRGQRGHVVRPERCRDPWTNRVDARFSRVFPAAGARLRPRWRS